MRQPSLGPLLQNLAFERRENGQQPINNNGKLLKPGRYYTVSENAQLNDYVLPFIDGLKSAEQEGMAGYALELEFNFENNLTHDGQSKPRKEDIFKKIKNLFTSK